MSLLIDGQRFINLAFHYLEIPEKHITRFHFIQSQEEYEKKKDDPNLKELQTGWKVIDWSEHNKLYSECIEYKTNEEGITVSNLDFIKFRDMKLKTCLKTWNLKDESGKAIVVEPKVIDRLHPDVANELLNGFERVTELGAAELKN